MPDETENETVNETPAPEAPPPGDARPAQPQPARPEIVRDSGPIHIMVDKVDEVAALMAKARVPEGYNPNVPFTVMHESMKVMDLEHNMPHPARMRKNIVFTTVESFLEYYQDFHKGQSPRLFTKSGTNGMTILCVFDYDKPGDESDSGITLPLPQWNSHRATLQLKYHEDYGSLKAANEVWFDQEEFALFIEARTGLFKDPDGATMLEMAQHLKGTRNVTWQSGKRLSNSQSALEYIEVVKAQSVKGEIEVPEHLTIRCPVYEGLVAEDLLANFRWKIGPDKKAQFSYRLITHEQERRAAEEVKMQVASGTGKNLLQVASFDGITA